MTLTGLAGPVTLQLNVTWIYGNAAPAVLRYAWNDYPPARHARSQQVRGTRQPLQRQRAASCGSGGPAT